MEIDRLIRLGGAWTTFRGKRLKILQARIESANASGTESASRIESNSRIERNSGAATLTPTRVQPEGKPPMDYAAWRNGARPGSDESLGS